MTLTDLFNLCRVFPHGPRNSGSLFCKDNPMTSSSSSFWHTEFQRALKEQVFGIKSFAIVSSSSQEATASIVTLEGSKLLVRLTTQGYSISTTNSDSNRVYETIEDLLQAASPLYIKKRQEVLFAKLSKLS